MKLVEESRGFEPYSHFFSHRSRRYHFRPNLKLLVALLPYLYNEGPPKRVICPMAGVGAAPVMTLAFFRETTRVVVWEEDEFWRSVCLENLRRNSFCSGRYEVLPPDLWGEADGAVLATAPKEKFSGVRRWYDELSRNLKALSKSLVGGTIVIVSKRVDQGYREYVHTEDLILSALHWNFPKASVEVVGEVEGKDEIRRPVFVIARA